MGLYRVCPTCGNSEEKTIVHVCCSCGTIFCDRCGNKEFDNFPLPFTTMHCPRCGSTELNSNGLTSNNDKGISQIIRDEDSVTIVTDEGSCVTADQRSYWLDSENQRRFDEAVEEALRRDSEKSNQAKDIHQTMISNDYATSINVQSGWNNQSQNNFRNNSTNRITNSYNTSRPSTSQLLDEAMSKLQQERDELNNTTNRVINNYNASRVSTHQLLDETMSKLQQKKDELNKHYSKNATIGICRGCGKQWPMSVLENGNGLCPLCQRVHERQR